MLVQQGPKPHLHLDLLGEGVLLGAVLPEPLPAPSGSIRSTSAYRTLPGCARIPAGGKEIEPRSESREAAGPGRLGIGPATG